jgi:hypothetical protein
MITLNKMLVSMRRFDDVETLLRGVFLELCSAAIPMTKIILPSGLSFIL